MHHVHPSAACIPATRLPVPRVQSMSRFPACLNVPRLSSPIPQWLSHGRQADLIPHRHPPCRHQTHISFTGTPAGSAKSKLTTVIMVSFPYNPNHLIPSDGGNHPSAAPNRMCPDSSADSCDVSGLRNLIFATVLLLAHVFEHIGWNQFHRRRQLTFKNREFHVPNLV